eukprot:75512-Rhodomonas_salina.2
MGGAEERPPLLRHPLQSGRCPSLAPLPCAPPLRPSLAPLPCDLPLRPFRDAARGSGRKRTRSHVRSQALSSTSADAIASPRAGAGVPRRVSTGDGVLRPTTALDPRARNHSLSTHVRESLVIFARGHVSHAVEKPLRAAIHALTLHGCVSLYCALLTIRDPVARILRVCCPYGISIRPRGEGEHSANSLHTRHES